MLNWDDYNESDKIQKPQKIQEAQPVLAEEKVEAIEENISEYSPVEAGDRAKQAQEAIEQCYNFSGVYDVVSSGKEEMEFTSTTTVGFPDQTVKIKIVKK